MQEDLEYHLWGDHEAELFFADADYEPDDRWDNHRQAKPPANDSQVTFPEFVSTSGLQYEAYATKDAWEQFLAQDLPLDQWLRKEGLPR